jgi:hypothetical protein
VMGVVGVGGWVRSKPRVEWWSQKFWEEPMRALRVGGGVVEAMLVD